MPALVTLHVWRVPPWRVPAALLHMAADRLVLRRVAGLRFAKLLGTGDGTTFTVRDGDPTTWALLGTWASRDAADDFERSPTAARWRRISAERWRGDLVPLSSRGRWSGREPFGRPSAGRWAGPVAALTRARLVPRRAMAFWRAVPPVSADLRSIGGLRASLGIGELPVGLQGTFSVWDTDEVLRDFAYRRPAHIEAIRRTAEEGWY
ncbi:MAG: monooxygenase, partial [Pseudonocardiales bacterium]